MSTYVPQAVDQQSIGIVGYDGESANFADFTEFLRRFRPDAYEAGYNFTSVSVNGGTADQSRPSGETNMDTQAVAGMAYPIPSTFFPVGYLAVNSSTAQDKASFNHEAFYNYLLGLPTQRLPKVVTTSFGDDEQSVSPREAERLCNYLMALGARGASMIFATGDYGVGGGVNKCVSNGNGSPNGTAMFKPTFLSTYPYATTVGATMNFAPEVVATFGKGSSSAGFSNYFPTPWYQTRAVSKYLDSIGDQYKGLYNRTGRAIPDIAMQGKNYGFVSGGKSGPNSGTSLSAPLFAGVVALLNDVQLSRGKPSLGFLNPLIYQKWLGTPVLNDITQGSNQGCGTDGFPALPGWDPATGAGTPDFEALKRRLYA